MVMPCCWRHFWNAVRLALVLAPAAAGVEVDVVLLVVVLELAPQAAIATLVAIVARPSIARRARRGVVFRGFMSGGFLSRGADQPAVPALVEVEPALVRAALAPESLTEVAVIAPPELLRPWMTTVSPGRTADFEALSLLVSLVAEERVTLTVLPELSVR
jgi:hypothetical protein